MIWLKKLSPHGDKRTKVKFAWTPKLEIVDHLFTGRVFWLCRYRLHEHCQGATAAGCKEPLWTVASRIPLKG